MQFKTLQVSFINADFPDLDYSVGELGCVVQLRTTDGQSQFVDVALLSDPKNRAFVPIAQADTVQFVVKRMINNKFVGSISVPLEEMRTQKTTDWQQWFTLFDTVEDDAFDGQLLENDEETPRIFLQFKLLTQEIRSPSPAKSPQEITTQKFSVSSGSYGYSETPSVQQFHTKRQQEYSPRFDTTHTKEQGCQADIMSADMQSSYVLRLELEKMNEYRRKYEQSKRALQKIQSEYTDMFNIYNQQMEEKDHELATLANKNNQLRSQLEFLQQKTKLQQSEIDTLRNVSARPEEAKQYHTFQQPQTASQKSKLIIDDMGKQLRNTKLQLQQSENHAEFIEAQYSELQEQFKQVINENTAQKIQFLKQLQSSEDVQSKQNAIIQQITDKLKRCTQSLDQKVSENSFLEREVQRLVQDCEWSQKTIFRLNQQLEDMRLKHLEDLKSMQAELGTTSQDLNNVESERTHLNQTLQIRQTQLDSYLSVVGTLENYMGLLTRYQDSEQRKCALQLQVTELAARSTDELARWGNQMRTRTQLLKEEYEQQLSSSRQDSEHLRGQCQDQSSQIKALQMEIVRMSHLITKLKDENDTLAQHQRSLELHEHKNERIETQMMKLTKDYIAKTEAATERGRDLPRPVKY